MVLELYSTGALHQRVEELLTAIGVLDSESRDIVGLSALLTLCNFQDLATFMNLLELTGGDKTFDQFQADIRSRDLVGLLSMNQRDIILRSPALSQFVIRRIFGLKNILMIALRALNYIDKNLADEDDFFSFAKVLLKYSTYTHFVSSKNDSVVMGDFYDQCRILRFAQKDPLFWVQRSICSMISNDFTSAEKFVETSFATARNLRNFDTYQIENHSARLTLTRSLIHGVSDRGEKELAASNRLQTVLSRKSDDLYHPLSVMSLFSKIVEKHSHGFDQEQRAAFISAIDSSIQSIASAGSLSSRFRRLPELENSLKAAKATLSNQIRRQKGDESSRR